MSVRATSWVRRGALTGAAWMLGVIAAAGQPPQGLPPLVFTEIVPDTAAAVGTVQNGLVIGDRALALLGDRTFDPGFGVAVRLPGDVTVQSVTSSLHFMSGRSQYASFQQVEVLRSVAAGRNAALSVGGGIRQEWGGTRVLIGRATGSVAAAGGWLHASGSIQKAFAIGRDRADVITTVGWLHRVAGPLEAGVEGIGQDLEGFWQKQEAEGGARLLLGPAVHAASKDGRWSVSMAGGALLRSRSVMGVGDASQTMTALPASGRYAVLGTLTRLIGPSR